MTLRTIIVDDEVLARRGVRTLLEDVSDVEIVGECDNGEDAIEAIVTFRPDLVYLDIKMPGINGFDVMGAVGGSHCPHVVFVTAYDEFAVQAFEVKALDYLLKPIDKVRLRESVERARAAHNNRRDETALQRLAKASAELRQCLGPLAGLPLADRLSVKTRSGLAIVLVENVDWVEADRDYVSLHVGKKIFLLHETITWAEARLARAGFLRIHRSILVNGSRVRELRPLSKGEYTVVLVDGTILKLSRSYRNALESLTGRG